MEVRASPCEFCEGHKHSAHKILWTVFLKQLFIQFLKLECLPSQRSPLYCPLGLTSTTFWSLSICVSVYRILIYICPFFKINVLLSFSSVGVSSLTRILPVCSRVRKREREKRGKAAFGFLPPAHSSLHPSWIRQRQWSSSVSKGKGHRNYYFIASWSSGFLETMMLHHSLCSGTSINLLLDNLQVKASEKHLGLYHYPLFPI